MILPCGCCQGVERLTPEEIFNRPGLRAIAYRVGTHATFFETMVARLSGLSLNLPGADSAAPAQTVYPLRGLTTRQASDFSIALLDAWATVADVLTFYQERIANEGYLATARHRCSVLQLARLVGYRLRPGVSASVFLAFTLEQGKDGNQDSEIPSGTRAQSIPGPGELPQPFETGEKLVARASWNNLQPRLTRPQKITCRSGDAFFGAPNIQTLYLRGTATRLKPGDPLLIVCGDGQDEQFLRFVQELKPDSDNDRTKVILQPSASVAASPAPPREGPVLGSGGERAVVEKRSSAFEGLGEIVANLSIPPSRPPRDATRLSRRIEDSFAASSDTLPQLLATLRPQIATSLYQAWKSQAIPRGPAQVYALRVQARLFGHNAPPRITSVVRGVVKSWGDWPIFDDEVEGGQASSDHEQPTVLYLDSSYQEILPGSWLVVETGDAPHGKWFLEKPASEPLYAKAGRVQSSLSRTDYGMSAKTTRIDLEDPANPTESLKWFGLPPRKEHETKPGKNFWAIRDTVVYAQSEELPLAEEPLDAALEQDAIELGSLYDGLQAGRWIIISGNRTDVGDGGGVPASELAMVATVEQAGDPIHTILHLAKPLNYRYARESATIHGNVVKSTHGETRPEILGSGDAGQTLQSFTLSKPPLTYLAAPTVSGAQSTLEVRVNGVLWHEADSLAEMGPGERRYFTEADETEKTSAIFGDGEHGARLPTGTSNVKAVYRSGIGAVGNVVAGKISQLVTRPLAVKDVINPLPATGGADPDTLEQARRNTPVAVMALDRLVSIDDYAYFARAYAGIGKASSQRLSFGNIPLVHVTIAGTGDIPIDESSDLFQNLALSLHEFGDPAEPIQLAHRSALLLVISAQVRVSPDDSWENVQPRARAAMLEVFGFDSRDLGQDALQSEVFATLQQVEGVEYVKMRAFGAVSDSDSEGQPVSPKILAEQVTRLRKQADPANLPPRIVANLADVTEGRILPAQIAYLSDKVPDCLLLTELTG